MRNFVIICIVNFSLYFSTYLTMISETNYAKIELFALTSTSGLITFVYVLGLIFSTLIFGKFVDRVNLKKALFIIIGLEGVITFGYLFANSIEILLILRVLTGILFGIGTCICNTTISKIIPESKKGVGIGYFSYHLIGYFAIFGYLV
ncbi:MFS transporter [Campylobacter sp. FMV-PI01]|uniref:MFS transporter n=1 Tax=Campylobacter portucalensis TaxID=2608384 RepID=A0A6L5WIM7_9BACT|nr:MFS transporter [Campylobacter portucalensis]MSN96816.1 MFS transporter [Campylobacter portucalensis]